MLATYSFLPIIESYASKAGVPVETRDISLAGRIIAQFPDRLTDEQRMDDALAELGELAKTPEANIIKLPNISASIPQLKAAIKELQEQGYDLPDYPSDPQSDEEKDVRERYDRVKGSAVNPVLREGNSDRRAPASVKNYVRSHPHSMGEWSSDSKTNVATMDADDFRHNEKSHVMESDGSLRISHVDADGNETVLRESVDGARGRGRRRDLHERQGAAGVPQGPDQARRGRGHPVLGPPQGHDDEGLRPDHLRPRRRDLPARRLRAVRRQAGRGRPVRQRRARRDPQRPRRPRGRRRDQGRDRGGPRRPGPTWPTSTPARASPTCTCPATSSSTPRCRR